ncbi:GNAT family N-acetyltransferase [Zhihengliuella alba]|uniref:GNAT family N-acetyltransferase n=1 Tax=Zhihengliuella alba TaxID=547018 RepID=A0ABP7DYC3_9MICC
MRIRGFTEDDVELLAGLARDQRVVRYVGDGRPWSDARIAERARQALNPGDWGEVGRDRWGIVWCDGLTGPAAAGSPGDEVGVEPQTERIGLCVAKFAAGDDAIEIGYWLDPDYWGRRLARPMVAAVVDWVDSGLRRAGRPPADLVARIQPANLPSAAAVRGLGFDCVAREAVPRPGGAGADDVDVYVRRAARIRV